MAYSGQVHRDFLNQATAGPARDTELSDVPVSDAGDAPPVYAAAAQSAAASFDSAAAAGAAAQQSLDALGGTDPQLVDAAAGEPACLQGFGCSAVGLYVPQFVAQTRQQLPTHALKQSSAETRSCCWAIEPSVDVVATPSLFVA